VNESQGNHSSINEHHYSSVRESLVAGRKEILVIIILIAVYVYVRFIIYPGTHQYFEILIILGLVCGTWLAFRPSEWAVEGVESGAGHLGFTAYVAGMLTSLASNMPEAVVSGIAAFNGYTSGSQDLLDIAVLSVMVSAGFNMFLLGITIMIATRGKADDMEVPVEAIKKDSVLIRWTIVALLSMFALGVVFHLNFIVSALEQLSNGGTFNIEDIKNLSFPQIASFVLMSSYIVYAAVLVTGDVADSQEKVQPHHKKSSSIILTLVGLIGIFFAGEILTNAVEIFLEHFSTSITDLTNPVRIAALILGAAGALPENGIAVIAAAKGKIGLAVGNLIGGILQIVLLVAGGIGIFVPIPLDTYVLFQIVVIAGSLWFLKRAITDDHRLDFFEGAMIILLQAYVFILFLFPPIT
jgi:cation:H+ antiporter